MLKKLLGVLIDAVGVQVVEQLVKKYITLENIKKLEDQLLDVIENGIEGTKFTIDDKLVLPAIKKIREVLDIEEKEGSPYEDKPKEGN